MSISVWLATNLESEFVSLIIEFAFLLSTNVSMYAFVQPSALAVGVARFIILCEFRETLPYGAVILSSVIVFTQYLASATWRLSASVADVASPSDTIF